VSHRWTPIFSDYLDFSVKSLKLMSFSGGYISGYFSLSGNKNSLAGAPARLSGTKNTLAGVPARLSGTKNTLAGVPARLSGTKNTLAGAPASAVLALP
jgi:hypothetical protein